MTPSESIFIIFFLGFCGASHSNLQIYMDWANNYLERAKSKRRVNDLSNDCRDGVLLADIIEAVTACKVPDLNKKPKNHSQMVSFSCQCLPCLVMSTSQMIEFSLVFVVVVVFKFKCT